MKGYTVTIAKRNYYDSHTSMLLIKQGDIIEIHTDGARHYIQVKAFCSYCDQTNVHGTLIVTPEGDSTGRFICNNCVL